METLFQNVRYGLRSLAKNPGFTVIAVLTLGIGIGINASIFSLISGILLRQPPVRDPGHVVVVVATNLTHNEDRASLTPAEFLAWREQANSFTSMAAVEEIVVLPGADLTSKTAAGAKLEMIMVLKRRGASLRATTCSMVLASVSHATPGTIS